MDVRSPETILDIDPVCCNSMQFGRTSQVPSRSWNLCSTVGSHTKAIPASLWQDGGLQSHPQAKIREVCHHPTDLDAHLPTIETI